jgi:hypothetical protein
VGKPKLILVHGSMRRLPKNVLCSVILEDENELDLPDGYLEKAERFDDHAAYINQDLWAANFFSQIFRGSTSCWCYRITQARHINLLSVKSQ